MWVRTLGREDPLEEGLAPHSSFGAWRIPWTEEPGRLQSTGSQESDTLPDPGIKPTSLMSPALAGEFFSTRTTGEARVVLYYNSDLNCISMRPHW